MRVVIRNEIDIDKPLNLRRLSPVTKIVVAFRKQLQTSVFFEKRRMKAEQAKNRARIVKEDSCKESISTRLYQELVLNKSMQNSDSVIREVVIAVNADYRDVIHDQKDEDGSIVKPSIFRHNEFSQYEIVPVQEGERRLENSFPRDALFVCVLKKVTLVLVVAFLFRHFRSFPFVIVWLYFLLVYCSFSFARVFSGKDCTKLFVVTIAVVC